MTLSTLKNLMAEDGGVLSAWSGLRDVHVVEALLRAPFGAVAFDMQHGFHDARSIEAGIGRAAMLGKPAIVRLPIEDRANAARALDFGASAVVMPMIESAADARAFADAVKYPPLGHRSFGPGRAADLHGFASVLDYMAAANAGTLAFAMIETAAALDNLGAILAVPGIDGVFVGPSDLSIALSGTGTWDPHGAVTDEAIRSVAEAAGAAGKPAAIYALGADDAWRYRSYGYRLVCVSSDAGLLKSGATQLVTAILG